MSNKVIFSITLKLVEKIFQLSESDTSNAYRDAVVERLALSYYYACVLI